MIPDPTFTEEDAFAMQAFAAGVANEGQQRRVMRFIQSELCGIWRDEMSISTADRDVFHASGRRYVGIWINKLSDPGLPDRMRKAEEAAKLSSRTSTKPKRPK